MNIKTKEFYRQEFKEFRKLYRNGGKVSTDIVDHLAMKFLEAGVRDHILLEMMSSDCIDCHFEKIMDYGMRVDFSRMLDKLSPQLIAANLEKFISWGFRPEMLMNHMYYPDIEQNMDILFDAGLPSDKFITKLHEEGEKVWLCNNLSPELLAKNLDRLRLWECDPDLIVDRMYVDDIETNIVLLMSSGASADKLIARLRSNDESSWVSFNWDLFRAYYPSRDLASCNAS